MFKKPEYQPEKEEVKIEIPGGLREEDTRVKLFDPQLKTSGWTEENIRRNYYISKGKIIIEGDKTKRGEKKFADYVLFYNQSFPIAVIEAKREFKHPADGISKAKDYAERLNLQFAYSTNGHGIEEFDFSTNLQKSIDHFLSPQELYERWQNITEQNIPDFRDLPVNPLIFPLHYDPQKSPYYFQLVAIRKVIEAVLKGQKRILLTMATGTGKTYTAFQVIWKLVKSGYLKKVLYVADRTFLRDQAFNELSPFGDARDRIIEGKAPKVRDIYFTMYQSLFSGDGNKGLYQEYPPDFFDLIIIDECHRSGFGTWHDILKHFSSAIHFGMTATPKRDDNIDTYAYFGNPVYEYDIIRGIEDGYLANYLVQRIFTNLDKSGGISLEEARLKGAEIYYPVEDPERIIKDYYNASEFEKDISVPDRTKIICQNLAKLLGTYGPTDRTVIYCVNTDHAEDVKKALQNHFAHLGYSDYAVRIVAEDQEAKRHYENFKDSEKTIPVVATTVDLLTTGVDIPSIKNIVFLRALSSVVLFNQIIGRGTRIDEASGKYHFRIIDYTGATRLFEKLLPSPPPEGEPKLPEPSDYFLKGLVFDAETQLPIEDAKVIVIPRPNEQVQTKTDKEGFFFFDKLPRYSVTVIISKSSYIRRELKKQTLSSPTQIFSVALHKERIPRKPVIIDNIPVHIETEEEFLIEAGGERLRKAEYIKYSKRGVKEKVVNLDDLRKIWLADERRNQFLEDISKVGISPQVISSVILRRSDIDGFDALAHIAFDAPIISRDERAKALITLKQRFIESFSTDTREVILDLIDQYRIAGIEDLKPEVFKLHRFIRKYGSLKNVVGRFKTPDLQPVFNELKTNIYSG